MQNIQIELPFSEAQFLDVFGRYNAMFWPVAAGLWIASAALIAIALRRRAMPHRTMSALLAVLWAWSAGAYHAAFFTRVNPAAWLFAGIFLLQAFLLLRIGVGGDLRFWTARGFRASSGAVLIAFALAYPFLNLAQGLAFPRMPTYGVPCPTAILTAGLLLSVDRPPWTLTAIPFLWSLIGGSASLLLGVHADLMLFAAAALLAAFTLRPRAPRRTQTPVRSSLSSRPSWR